MEILLPAPAFIGKVSLEEAIYKRRSIRQYKPGALSLSNVSQLLWASSGITSDGHVKPKRSYPSAGASYPLEVYLVAGEVDNIEKGMYYYNWQNHSIKLLVNTDVREKLSEAAHKQNMIKNAPVSLVFTAILKRTTLRYGSRGEYRYVPMDAGAAFQNVHLQAQALELGTVIIGAFLDEDVKKVLNLQDEIPLGIMPVGRI